MSIQIKVCCYVVMTFIIVATIAAVPKAEYIWYERGNQSEQAITNITTSLQIVGIHESSDKIELSLKNTSNQYILALAVSVIGRESHNRTNHYEDWVASGLPGLAPGETHKLILGSQEVVGRRLEISALIKDDGSAEGSGYQINFLKSKWIGIISETSRINTLLHEIQTIEISDSTIERLGSDVGPLPETVEDALVSLENGKKHGTLFGESKSLEPFMTIDGSSSSGRAGFLTGMRIARERALSHISSLMDLNQLSKDAAMVERRKSLNLMQKWYEKQDTVQRKILKIVQGGRIK
jgi:hypothetical protein